MLCKLVLVLVLSVHSVLAFEDMTAIKLVANRDCGGAEYLGTLNNDCSNAGPVVVKKSSDFKKWRLQIRWEEVGYIFSLKSTAKNQKCPGFLNTKTPELCNDSKLSIKPKYINTKPLLNGMDWQFVPIPKPDVVGGPFVTTPELGSFIGFIVAAPRGINITGGCKKYLTAPSSCDKKALQLTTDPQGKRSQWMMMPANFKDPDRIPTVVFKGITLGLLTDTVKVDITAPPLGDIIRKWVIIVGEACLYDPIMPCPLTSLDKYGRTIYPGPAESGLNTATDATVSLLTDCETTYRIQVYGVKTTGIKTGSKTLTFTTDLCSKAG